MSSKEEGKTLSDHAKAIAVAQIENFGTKLILPDGMSIVQGIDLLKRRQTYLDEVMTMHESFDVFPYDGAHAFDQVLTNKYGWSPSEATPTMFGPIPPKMVSIEVAYGVTKQVPWGRFSLPGIEGWVSTGVTQKDGRYVFAVNAEIKRINEPDVKALLDALRTYLKTGSIYRGQAFKIRFKDDNGAKLNMPEPRFIDTTDIDENMLVYSDTVMSAINTNLFTPIKRVRDCIANNLPIKRGILLGGPYGTGKTLAAKVASKYAVENGVGYVYVQRADELADAVMFAKAYADPACVIFCEDIDRAMNGERTEAMDDILNIIDGIDTKNSNLIVVLTTNHLDNINPAMLRPGRLDAVIEVLPPDAQAVEKLIRYYGFGAIDASIDLSVAAKKLEGRIPAVIAEVVKRAKLAQLSMQEPGTQVTQLSSKALEESADTMASQLDLLYRERNVVPTTVDSLISNIVKGIVGEVPRQVREVHEQTVG